MQRDQQSLLDIVDSIALIFEYVTDWGDFIQSIKDQDAVIRRLTIVASPTIVSQWSSEPLTLRFPGRRWQVYGM